MYNLLKKLIYYANTALFSAAFIICIASVVFRYIFNDSIIWAEEAVRFLFIMVFFLGAAEACRQDKHIFMDLVVDVIPEKPRKILRNVTDLISILFLLYIAYLAFQNCLVNMNQKSPALGWSYGYLYMIIPIGCILMSFFLGCNMYERFRDSHKGGGRK